MPDTVRKVHYFSTSVPDKPGQTFNVLAALVSGGVNLLACAGTTRGRSAQIDVVPDDTRKFASAAKKAGLTFSEKIRAGIAKGQQHRTIQQMDCQRYGSTVPGGMGFPAAWG